MYGWGWGEEEEGPTAWSKSGRRRLAAAATASVTIVRVARSVVPGRSGLSARRFRHVDPDPRDAVCGRPSVPEPPARRRPSGLHCWRSRSVPVKGDNSKAALTKDHFKLVDVAALQPSSPRPRTRRWHIRIALEPRSPAICKQPPAWGSCAAVRRSPCHHPP